MVRFTCKSAYYLGVLLLLISYIQGIISFKQKQNDDTPCGTIIDAVIDDQWNPFEGQIIYKPSVNYEANERCVWTIRTPSHTFPESKMEFRLDQAEFENEGDKIVVDLFDYGGNTTLSSSEPHVGTLLLTKESIGVTQEKKGSVAIISFTTEGSLGKGFILSYKVTDMECSSSVGSCEAINFTDVINAEPQGVIIQTDEMMDNRMMSTYVLPPANFQYNSNSTSQIVFKYSQIEECVGRCCDTLFAYTFTDFSGLILLDQFCGNVPDELLFFSDDTLVFVLVSDDANPSKGFEIRRFLIE